VEGVVDKDLAAAILAREAEASTLLILTDVPAVQRGYGTPQARAIARLPVGEARELLGAGEFGSGSMGPKVQAAVGFCSAGGKRAIIAELGDALRALRGESGTLIEA
jgi:carbamate kinase